MAVSLAVLLTLALSAEAAIDDTSLVSRVGGGGPGADSGSSGPLAVSNSGRFIAFVSDAANLSPDAVSGVKNVYVRDTVRDTTTLVSRATGPDGAGASADSGNPAIGTGGRYVAFDSVADNLSDADDDAVRNVYLRDTKLGTTTLVSRADGADGAAGDADSSNPSVSAYADEVAFESDAGNLTADAHPNVTQVFVRSKVAKTTRLVSRGSPSFAVPAGAPADDRSFDPSISSNGLRVAFASDADNLSTKENDAVTNIFVRDLVDRSTTPITCTTGYFENRCPIAADDDSLAPALSADGRYVAFQSGADDLSDQDDNAYVNVFLRDTQSSATTLVNRAWGADGAVANSDSVSPSVSGEGQGQFVAFLSGAENLSDADVATFDVFVRDTLNGTTALASRAGGAAGAAAAGSSSAPAISGDGRAVAFLSEADNLSAADRDDVMNVFMRELNPSPPPPFVPPPEPTCHHGVCDPGTGGTGTDHGAHGAAGGAHTGHSDAGHAGHTGAPGTVAQTLFAPGSQSVRRLFVMVQVHQASRLTVAATVAVPGRRTSRVYRFKVVTAQLPIHAVRKVSLKLSRTALRAVKKALAHGRRLRVKVTATAVDATGNRGTAKRSIRLKP